LKKKKCNSCQKVLPVSSFTKNKNTKDSLSYYCKECTKKHKKLYYYQQGNERYEPVIIDSLKQDKDIKIYGLDKEKVINTVITIYDFPGVVNNLLYDLPIFLKKYNFTYEEYKFFIQQCHKNKFWIEPKDLNTRGDQ
jgi:hypothetical protein